MNKTVGVIIFCKYFIVDGSLPFFAIQTDGLVKTFFYLLPNF